MLVDTLLEANRRSASTLAVSDGTRSLTYQQLTRLAFVLRGLVQRETDCPRLGLLLPASTAFPAALFGVLWASRIAVPLNFLLRPEELARVVEDAGLDLILTTGHFRDLYAKLPARSLCLEELALPRKLAWTYLRRMPPPPTVHPHDTAVILYTSGTTAEPKGVELTYNNLYRNCVDAIASLNIQGHPTMLNVLPPFHVFGLTAGVLVPVVLGASVHALPRFSPLGVLKALPLHQVSVMMAIPSMYGALLRAKSATRAAFGSLYLAISGGEPLPASVRTAFHERFGVALREGYGLTETSPVVSGCSVECSRDGTVGKPIRNVEIRIVGSMLEDLPSEHDGEILVRGPCVMKGYYNKPQETQRVIDPQGWFHTGDIGRLDSDGFLRITGRAKEMLIIGGENVFPREIEAVLETHEAVLQAAVIGVPDESRGEAPIAFVIPRHGSSITEHELRRHARLSLAGYKVPQQVHIREDLPVGPTGKILKRRLGELV